MPDPAIPSWLREVDPDAARRMARAYDTPPHGAPAAIELSRATVGSIRRRIARLPPRPDRLLGVTLVEAAAFAHLTSAGWLGPEPAHTEQDWRPAYDWMRWRMLGRLPSATGRYPMWLWPARDGSWVEPLRLAERGDVALLVELPADEVLLSDFGDWHCVLNCWPALPATCAVCGTRFCEVHEPPELDDLEPGPRWPTVTGDDIRRLTPGWDEIFDSRRHTERPLQATCELVRAEDVVGAFEVRRSRRR